MIRITYRGGDASITVGRDSPAYVFGGRDLPEDIRGFPAFILDTRGLGVDGSGNVYRDGSVNYEFGGGTDGRDLTRRPISPIGEFAYTPATINVSDEETENEDGSTTTVRSSEFDLAGTMRRMTGETALEIELGPESLGALIPGKDFSIGEKVLLSIWGRDIEAIVSGFSHSPTGWTATVQTEDQIRDYEAQKRRLSSTTLWEEIEEIREELRDLEGEQDYTSMGGHGLGNSVGDPDYGGEIPPEAAGVIRVEKDSDGKYRVTYADNEEVFPADVSDIFLEDDELVIMKGEEEEKRLKIPGGSGSGSGTGNGNLHEHYLDILKRSDASYSDFGLEEFFEELDDEDYPRPDEEERFQGPYFTEETVPRSGTWVLGRGFTNASDNGLMIIKATRPFLNRSETFLVRVVTVTEPVYGNRKYIRLVLTESSVKSMSGFGRINPPSDQEIGVGSFTNGTIFARKIRFAFGNPEEGTPPSTATGSSDAKIDWVFLPSAATRYSQQIEDGMAEPRVEGEKVVKSVTPHETDGYIVVEYTDLSRETFKIGSSSGGGGGGVTGVESVTVQSGYLRIDYHGQEQPVYLQIPSGPERDPYNNRLRAPGEVLPINQEEEFIDFSDIDMGIIILNVAGFSFDHGTLEVRVYGLHRDPEEPSLDFTFFIPITHGYAGNRLKVEEGFRPVNYVEIDPDNPVRGIGNGRAAASLGPGLNTTTGRHSESAEIMIGPLFDGDYEDVRVRVFYQPHRSVYLSRV